MQPRSRLYGGSSILTRAPSSIRMRCRISPRSQVVRRAEAQPVIAEATTGSCRPLGDRADLDRLGALRALALLELHACTLGERLVAIAGDAAVVNEEILRPAFRGDKAIPFRVVEPLDGSVSHKNTSPTQFR